MISYEQIRQVIEGFATNHLQVKRFYSDYEDQLSTYSTKGEDFPVLYMTPIDGLLGFTQNEINVRLYCFDIIMKDRENWNVIMSDCQLILNDLYKYLQSEDVEAIDTETQPTIVPINDALMDYVAGWYMDVVIQLDTYSDCIIPFSETPVYTPYQGLKIVKVMNTNGLYSQTAQSTPIVATSSELSLINGGVGSLSIPANGFSIGDSFECKLSGFLSSKNNSELRIKIKSGSTILSDSGFIVMKKSTNKSWDLRLTFTIRNTGVDGIASIVTSGFLIYNKDADDLIQGKDFTSINSTTFNTIVPNTLSITAQWLVGDIDNSISTETFVLTKIY